MALVPQGALGQVRAAQNPLSGLPCCPEPRQLLLALSSAGIDHPTALTPALTLAGPPQMWEPAGVLLVPPQAGCGCSWSCEMGLLMHFMRTGWCDWLELSKALSYTAAHPTSMRAHH